LSDLKIDFDDQRTEWVSKLAQAKAEIKALSIDKESLSTEVKNLRDTIVMRNRQIASLEDQNQTLHRQHGK
jgi:chromosome segregation ATPase